MIPQPHVDLFFLTPDLISLIIKKLPNNKAPGSDRITTTMLKYVSPRVAIQLCHIFKATFNNAYFPLEWRMALVMAFPKSGKTHTSPSNYRPISLLSVLSKAFERVILSQISAHIGANKIIIDEQFGFKPEHSTQLQLLRVTEFISMEMNKNR